MGNSIWKRVHEKRIYDLIEEKVDSYFNDLYVKTHSTNINEDFKELEVVDVVKNDFTYREGQHNYALDVMDAIRNKKVLLIQAGVGCGKSYGYLIPIFNTFALVKGESVERFEKIIISTSNIALQYQLIRDIELISRELDIPIEAVIAKGVNNYACVKRIEKLINSKYTFDNRKEELNRILTKIREAGSCDKADLGEISKSVWKDIQLCGRGYCSNCAYLKECSFYEIEQKIKISNIIITNHANYISNVIKSANKDKNELLFSNDADMVVIDEAHKLEENLINVLEGEVRLMNIFYNLDAVYNFISENIYEEEANINDYMNYINNTKEKFRYLFVHIKRSASVTFHKNNRNNNSITDGNRLSFSFNKDILNIINIVRNDLGFVLDKLNKIEVSNYKEKSKRDQLINYLNMLYYLLSDMLLGNERHNIYWVSFYDEESINLGYVVKDKSVVVKRIFDEKIPIICTSATMLDGDNSYSYFRKGIGLEKINRGVEEAEEHLSPFDYDNNALFYYDLDIAVPDDKDNNICDLALKIGELIRATNGKALVLFTSKTRMKEVYDLLMMDSYPFKILIQNDSNADMVREEFEKDTNACLFATGSFWEGISIKGESLSNLIITHLPFDNVDAINKYEAGKYVTREEKMKNVYIPDMLVKMKQAIGRLIRSDIDTGIVSCLDSRVVNYLEEIRVVSPIKNFTNDMNRVYEFVDKKINNKENDKKLVLDQK